MLVLPLIVMLIIPRLTANDPQLQREMEQMQMPKVDMPDMSEMMANFFGGILLRYCISDPNWVSLFYMDSLTLF